MGRETEEDNLFTQISFESVLSSGVGYCQIQLPSSHPNRNHEGKRRGAEHLHSSSCPLYVSLDRGEV